MYTVLDALVHLQQPWVSLQLAIIPHRHGMQMQAESLIGGCGSTRMMHHQL